MVVKQYKGVVNINNRFVFRKLAKVVIVFKMSCDKLMLLAVHHLYRLD